MGAGWGRSYIIKITFSNQTGIFGNCFYNEEPYNNFYKIILMWNRLNKDHNDGLMTSELTPFPATLVNNGDFWFICNATHDENFNLTMKKHNRNGLNKNLILNSFLESPINTKTTPMSMVRIFTKTTYSREENDKWVEGLS